MTEMELLKAFVEEFSPIHQGQTEDLTYNELFAIISEIVDSHYMRLY